MGVVTDKSLQGLTTAVQGISTSGMSDTTGQAINNTLGTLMTNTTGQAINTTLQSLVGSISPAAANVTFDNTGTRFTSSNEQSLGDEIDDAVNEWQLVPNSTLDVGDTVNLGNAHKEVMIEINSNPTTAGNRGRVIVPNKRDGSNYYVPCASNNALVIIRLNISTDNTLTFASTNNSNIRIQAVYI